MPRKAIRFLSLGCTLATLLALTSAWASPEKGWLIPILGLTIPILLAVNLLFALGWLFLRDWAFFTSFACLLVALWLYPGLLGTNFREAPVTTPSFRVLSYNLHYLQEVLLRPGEEQAKAFESFFNFFNSVGEVNFLCVQETSSDSYRPIAEHLGYPHYFGNKGTMIFSRVPFLDKGFIDFGKTTNSCTWVDVLLDGKRIRLYSLHLESSHISSPTNYLAKQKDIDRRSLRAMKHIFRNYKNASKIRVQQARLVIENIHACPYPVILCGDFNEPPTSFVYRQFSKILKDSFREKGLGLGTTFAGNLPLLRIDYLFFDKKIAVQSHKVLHANFSDHYPVVCQFSF